MTRLRTEVGKRRRRPARPVSSASKLSLPLISPTERETVAFWFRRLSTTILFGNGAGVVGLGSYLSGTEDQQFAASIAYPALSLFLTGVILGFCCYLISFFWAAMRMDAYSALLDRIIENAPKAKPKGKKRPPSPIREHHWVVWLFLALGVAQLTTIIGAVACFYMGSAAVVRGLGALACGQAAGHAFCSSAPSILFPKMNVFSHGDDLVEEILQEEGSQFGVVAVFSERIGPNGIKSDWPDRILVTTPPNVRIRHITTSVTVRTSSVDDQLATKTCLLELLDYSGDETSPLFVSRNLTRFFAHGSAMRGNSTLVPQWMDMIIEYEKNGEAGYARLRFDIVGSTLRRGAVRSADDAPMMANASPDWRGGLLIMQTPDQPLDLGCEATMSGLGYQVSRALKADASAERRRIRTASPRAS